MTTEKKIEIPAPPNPLNYKFEQLVQFDARGGFSPEEVKYQYTGKLSCTTCDEVLRDNACVDHLVSNPDSVYRRINEHNVARHPELVFVYTAVGWRQGISAGLPLLHN